MSDILAILALIALVAALAAVIYNHKAIVADVEKIDAVAGRVDTALVAPAVQAAKPVVTQSIAEIDAQVAAAVAAKPVDAADVAGPQPKAQ